MVGVGAPSQRGFAFTIPSVATEGLRKDHVFTFNLNLCRPVSSIRTKCHLCCLFPLLVLCRAASIHPSSNYLSRAGLQVQQSKQRHPVFSLSSHFFQLFRGESWGVPRPAKRHSLSTAFWVSPGMSSHWDMPGTPVQGGVQGASGIDARSTLANSGIEQGSNSH